MKHHSDSDRGGHSSRSRLSRSFPTWALKSPSRIMESPGGALSSTPNRDAKKAGHSALLPGPLAETTVRDLSPTRRRRDATLSSTLFIIEIKSCTALSCTVTHSRKYDLY
ncbi:hypothetical protein ILYODFUR_008842 [Ilyodon furcidens]|uniref:Uncharacterized protein n=1 Tax=Ilyodon furcidens TaxID=33524 RepID=A0ABV0SWB6_9TELE